MKTRFKVLWSNQSAWNFFKTPTEANTCVALLRMAGFSDAYVDWSYNDNQG